MFDKVKFYATWKKFNLNVFTMVRSAYVQKLNMNIMKLNCVRQELFFKFVKMFEFWLNFLINAILGYIIAHI